MIPISAARSARWWNTAPCTSRNASPVEDLIHGLLRGAQYTAHKWSFVHGSHRQGLILEDPDPFTLIQNALRAWLLQVLHGYLAFIDADQSGVVLILDRDIEYCSAHRNYRGGSAHTVEIRLPAQFLDVDLYPSEQDIEQVPPGAGIFTKNYASVRKDFEGTTVGNLENRKPIRTRNDDLARLHRIPYVEHPGRIVPQHRNLASHAHDLSRAALGAYRDTNKPQSRSQQPPRHRSCAEPEHVTNRTSASQY